MKRSVTPAFGALSVHTPPAAPGWRIGVMGGTFDPPHAGHAVVSEAASKRLGLDRLWWVVTPGNPLKSRTSLVPLSDRMAQAEALAGGNPRVEITGFETGLNTPYTAATLRFLRLRYPATRFVWIMGADNLASFHRWQDWRGIAATMPICVVDRPHWRLRALASPAAQAMARARVPDSEARRLPRLAPPAWVFLTTRLSDLSSTELRKKRGRGTLSGNARSEM